MSLLTAKWPPEKDRRRGLPAIPVSGDNRPAFVPHDSDPASGIEKPLAAGCAAAEAADGLDLRAQLAQRIVQAAAAPSLAQGTRVMLVTFHGGMLEGATCQVSVASGKVRCRLKARGAVARREIEGGRARVGGALLARGLLLDSFEVSR
ncbi:MAG TPA: hypothetical protein VM425_22430 [Myxococcota bacterium]|nr:hypothetical protein [Myxococcota bacterium]